MTTRLRALSIVMGTLLVSACTFLTSFDGFDVPKATPRDGEAEADAPPSVPSCSHKRWPDAPDSGGPADLGELVFAVRSLSLVAAKDSPVGFDLDNLCSCAEPVACVGAKANEPCDVTDSGVDNAASSLFAVVGALTGAALDESGLRFGLQRGRFGIVLKLLGYNGEANDPDVRLSVFNAIDVNPGSDAGAAFDGNDRWVVDEKSFVDGKLPLFFAQSAYVANDVLVASFNRLVINIRIPTVGARWLPLPVEAYFAWLTARVTRTATGLELTQAELGGRVRTASLLALAHGAGACAGTSNYESAKTFICGARDLPAEPALDGRSEPCDSLSFALSMTAIPAKTTAEPGGATDFTPCGDASPADDCR